MKRSDMKTYLVRYTMPTVGERALAAMDDAVNDGKLPPWDPEEPEGFAEFLEEWQSVPRLHTPPDLALAAWNACLSRQEAQQRTIEPKVDPEVRRKEIEAQIESWLEYYGITPGCPAQLLSQGTLRNMALRLLGVL